MQLPTYTQFKARTALLLASGNPSAASCAQDAEVALANAENGVPYPVSCPEGADAGLWLEAAHRWQARGASHAWGYNLPAGWNDDLAAAKAALTSDHYRRCHGCQVCEG
jgi:hypothetical protein